MTWQEYMQRGRQEITPKTLCVKITAQEFAEDQKRQGVMYAGEPIKDWKPSAQAVAASKKMLEEQKTGSVYQTNPDKEMNKLEYEKWKETRLKELEAYFGQTREDFHEMIEKSTQKAVKELEAKNINKMQEALRDVDISFRDTVSRKILTMVTDYYHPKIQHMDMKVIKDKFDDKIHDLSNDIYLVIQTCLGKSIEFCKEVNVVGKFCPIYKVMSKKHPYMDEICDYKYRSSLVPGYNSLLTMEKNIVINLDNILMDVKNEQWAKLEYYRGQVILKN